MSWSYRSWSKYGVPLLDSCRAVQPSRSIFNVLEGSMLAVSKRYVHTTTKERWIMLKSTAVSSLQGR